MSVLAAAPRRRGTDLLLMHMSGPVSRPPVSQRLEAQLGRDLTARLVAALARDQRDERRVRGSSSP
jgi:hypothetical protein